MTICAVSLGVAVFWGLRLAGDRAVAAFASQTGALGDEADFSIVDLAGNLDAATLERVRETAGIVRAEPVIAGPALLAGEVVRIAGRDLLAPLPATYEFRAIVPGPFAASGTGPDPDLLLNGRGVFLAERFAKRHRLRIGDLVVATIGVARTPLRVAAIVPQTAVFDAGDVVADVATAQALFGRAGRFDRIDCAASDIDAARRAVAARLPPGARIVTAVERRVQLERMVAGLRFDLAAAGLLAVVIAAALVYDSIAISVLQRRADIATLRALGTTRRAIARAFVVEGALLGTLGGLFGTVAGSLAAGSAGDPRAALAAVLIGVGLGTAGALQPASEATTSHRLRSHAYRRSREPHASAALLARLPPSVRLGIGNVFRAPRRLAVTLAALTLGVALAVALVTFASSFRTSLDAWTVAALRGDLVVRPLEGVEAARAARLAPRDVARVAALPGVASVEASRTVTVPFGGAFAAVTSDAGLRTGSIVDRPVEATIDATIARRAGLHAGDVFTLPARDGGIAARVTRIVDGEPFPTGTIAIARDDFVRAYRDDTADALEIDARPATDLDRLRRRVRATLAPRVLDVRTTRDLRVAVRARFDPIVADTFVVAGIALAMSGLGIVTSLFALVLERRDDIRLLRYAGLSRGGVRAMVVSEAALLGAFGGACGVVLGLIGAVTTIAIDRAAFGWTIVPTIPFAALAATLAASIAIACVAALGPARLATGRIVTAIVLFALVASHGTAVSARPHGADFAASNRPDSPRDVWRVLGHLRARDGTRFHVAATFFRYRLGAASPHAIDAAALAIIDEAHRTTRTAVRVDREDGGSARVSLARLDVRLDDWSLRAATNDVSSRIRLRASEDGAALDVELAPVAPPIDLDAPAPGGARRVSRSGMCNACVVNDVAYPRLVARGTLAIADRRYEVRGTFWIDRESGGRRFGPNERSERFTIQLDDGRALFLRTVRAARDRGATPAFGRSAPLVASGVFVSATGVPTYLGPRDFVVENPLRTTWRNVRDVPYPSLFLALVPRARVDLALVPVVQAQEIVPGKRGVPFYDGALDAERAHPGPRDTGVGYVELIGYDGTLDF